MRKKWRKVIAAIISAAMVTGAFASDSLLVQKAVEAAPSGEAIKVDINKDENRALAESLTFNNWKIGSAATHSTTIDGVTFTLSNGGTTGGNVRGALSKGILREGDTTSPRLTADGALIDFGDEEVKGGTIKLEISGLTAGTHTIKTWHSFFDAVVGSSMTLYINGEEKEKIDSITRAYTDDDAFITYNTVQVQEGETVTVLVKANGDGEYDCAVLNAFAIDDVNPVASIKNPYPAVGETHFQPEDGLSWTGADDAVSHDVYLGTDYEAVKNATTNSEEFLGNQTATSCAVDALNLSHTKTYYWRVDEHTDKGVFQGEVMSFEVAHLAFPSAEGYGRFAKGGRFGRVIEVTNLNDSGPGSLRQAVEEEKGPRIIVFRIGGVIQLKSRLKVPADGGNVYIAGQTAPGDGITLTHHAFGIYYAEDVIIRHVRLRVGDSNGVSTDGMGMAGANHSIIDHCSIAWTTDEGTSSRYADNITFQYNLIAEALNNSVHYDGNNRDDTERHSFAGSISGDIGSFHHNLLVNCTGRNWSLAGGMEQDGVTYAGKLDIRNNVVYNYRDRTTDGGVQRINFVNNYYKMGAVSRDMKIFTIDGNELGTDDMQMAYLSGNMLVDKSGKVILAANQNAWEAGRAASGGKNSTTADVRSDEPFFPSYVNTQTAEEAYTTVLASAGATVPKRDYLDTRYVNETENGTYTYTGSKDGLKGIIDSQEDVGGYPVLSGGSRILKDDDHDGMPNNWEEAHGLNPNDAEDRNGMNLSADGYTNLEMYLNELAGDTVNYADDTEVMVSFDDKYYEDINNIESSTEPSAAPSASPSTEPSALPSVSPSIEPSAAPSASPSAGPSALPSVSSSIEPSVAPEVSEEVITSKKPHASEEVIASPKPFTSEEVIVSKEPVVTFSEKPSPLPRPEQSVNPPLSEQEWMKGDVDNSKDVVLSDAQIVLKAALKIIKLDEVQIKAADVTGDGQVTLADAQKILRYALHIITSWK